MSDRSEIASHWRIVLACAVGVGAGIGGIPFYTLGMFIGPLQAEYDWTRAEVQAMFSVFLFSSLLFFPLVGWATDRFGVRRVAITGLVGTAIGYLVLSTLTQGLMSYYAGAVCLGVLGAGTTPISWTKAITGWFHRQRGLALGLVLAGTGVASVFAPDYVRVLIDDYGWREAYLGLAVIPLLALPIAIWLLRDPPKAPTGSAAGANAASGLTLGEAVRGYRFWVMALTFFGVSLGIAGSIPNLVPLLTDAGYDRAVVARLVGILGVTVILGRVISGYLLDKFWAPAVATFMLILPAISAVILTGDDMSIGVVAVAIVLIGFAAGAEFDLLAFLAGRYFGFASYSMIYSLLYVMLALGAAVAPPLFGYVYDTQGSYAGAMLVACVLFVAGSLLLLALGRYPSFGEADAGSSSQDARASDAHNVQTDPV